MIIGTEEIGLPGVLQEYKTSMGDVFQAGFGQAIDDNLVTGRLPDLIRSQTAGGEKLTKESALTRAKEAGVEVMNIPDDGLTTGAMDVLIERQYQRKRRNEAISSSGGGALNTMAEFSGGLAGSMVDPLNIAASFIPIGQARWAARLSKAASPLERAGIRAAAGAVEGAVGAVALEPFNYAVAQNVGDDYTMTESLMNIGFGTVMGAGLHMGAGAIGDAIKLNKSPMEAGPVGSVAKQLDAATPEVRMDYAKGAIASVMEDRPVDLAPIRQAQLSDVKMKLTDIQQKLDNAFRSDDFEAVSKFTQDKQRLINQLDPEDRRVITESRKKEIIDTELQNMIQEIEEARPGQRSGFDMVNPQDGQGYLQRIDTSSKSTFPDWYGRLGVKNKEDFISAIKKGKGPKFERIKAIAEDRLVNGYESNALGQNLPDNEFISLRDQSNSPLRTDPMDGTSRGDFTGVDSSTPVLNPDSRFIDNVTVEKHNQELSQIPREMRVEEAIAMADEAELELKELSSQAGIDIEATLKEANDIVKSADDYASMVKSMANCVTRKS